MDLKEIRNEAKVIAKENFWLIWGIIFITGIFNTSISTIYNFNGGNESTSSFIIVISSLLFSFIAVGAADLMLKLVRGEEVKLKEIFNFKDKYLNILLVTLVTNLAVLVGMLFLIVPGVIISIGLTFITYRLADENAEVDPIDFVKETYEFTKGYKKDIFIYTLQFMGLTILGLFTLGILNFIIIPRFVIGIAIFYEKIKLEKGI